MEHLNQLKFGVGNMVSSSTGRTGIVESTHYVLDYKNGDQQEVKKYKVKWDDNGISTWIHEHLLTLMHKQSSIDKFTAELAIINSQIDHSLYVRNEEAFYELIHKRNEIYRELEFLQ